MRFALLKFHSYCQSYKVVLVSYNQRKPWIGKPLHFCNIKCYLSLVPSLSFELNITLAVLELQILGLLHRYSVGHVLLDCKIVTMSNFDWMTIAIFNISYGSFQNIYYVNLAWWELKAANLFTYYVFLYYKICCLCLFFNLYRGMSAKCLQYFNSGILGSRLWRDDVWCLHLQSGASSGFGHYDTSV